MQTRERSKETNGNRWAEKAERYYRAKKIFGNHVNTNYVRISVMVGIEVQGAIVRRAIIRNTMHGKEKLAVMVQHTAVSSLMECTTL